MHKKPHKLVITSNKYQKQIHFVDKLFKNKYTNIELLWINRFIKLGDNDEYL